MSTSLIFADEEVAKLRAAMDWVIPRDSSPGAGTDAGVRHLIELVESLGERMIIEYRTELPNLREEDLDNRSNPFAQRFIDHVRDVYYGYGDTGAWEDIGFKVTA
jgi:hypothetical protein